MNTRGAVLILLLALATGSESLLAQSDSTRPERGKIDEAEREARRARREASGDCCEDAFFLFEIAGHVIRLLTQPMKGTGQGYQRYPYADPTDVDPFVHEHATDGRRFGTLGAQYFDDNAVGGTLTAGQFAWEGANGPVYAALEYTIFREPTQTDTDHLHTFRVAFGGVPRIGRVGFMRLGIAARGLVLDNGETALGPELELGVQAFPVRPWGIAASARGALVHWNWGGTTGMADLAAHGSYFVGRFELMAGWRYLKLGTASAFNGPTAGVRVWF